MSTICSAALWSHSPATAVYLATMGEQPSVETMQAMDRSLAATSPTYRGLAYSAALFTRISRRHAARLVTMLSTSAMMPVL